MDARARLKRRETSSHGTLGILTIDDWACFTLELPWRDNRPQISCIPDGDYFVNPWNSIRWPNSYHVTGVNGRSAILTHTGNLAADTSVGLKTHVHGCILVGKRHGWLNKQRAVLYSAVAMNELRNVVGRNNFDLKITWGG
jgi:hypothetical protein